MAIEARTLSIPYGSATNYFTRSNLDADVALAGFNMPLRLWLNTSGTATYNSNAMNILYPNANAHPVKAHISTNLGVLGSAAGACYLKFNNVTVGSSTGLTGGGSIIYRNIDTDLTNDAVINSNKSSSIVWNLTQASTGLLTATTLGSNGSASAETAADTSPITKIELSLYFNKWTVQALIGEPETTANAITYTSIEVSNSNPWDQDSITFTANLTSQGNFKGWYKDLACTELVSTANPYTTTATEDITLYAYVAALAQSITINKDSNLTSATVQQVGETTEYTFTATYPNNVIFLGWYSDVNKTTLVSNQSTFTTTISNSVTLYTDSIALEYEVYRGEKKASDIYIGDYHFS